VPLAKNVAPALIIFDLTKTAPPPAATKTGVTVFVLIDPKAKIEGLAAGPIETCP